MSQRPLNLLLICPDELRGDCVGFMGNPDIRTPHIDALAGASTIFPQHITSFPKCVPARISLMTGRYAHADGYRTIFQRMRRGTPNLLTRLRTAGYQSAIFGKNHCWEREDFAAGFDFASTLPPFDAYMEGVPAIRRSRPAEGGVEPLTLPPGYDYIGCDTRHAGDEAFVRQSCEFLGQARDPDRPFFLQVNLESPHPVYGVEEPWYSLYDRDRIRAWPHTLPRNAPRATALQREIRTSQIPDERALREIQAVYYGMISKVDEQVGKILDALREAKLWDDTVIVFLSDHGDYAGQYGLVEKWDTCFNDCLVHVPLTIRAPGMQAGHRVDSLSNHVDLAPTLLDLLQLEALPDVHGRSLVPVARGEARIEVTFSEGGHEAAMRARFDPATASPAHVADPATPLDAKQELYRRYPHTMARAMMATDSSYKLVVREDGDNEFYALEEDPWELNNRWADPSLASEREKLLLAAVQWQLATAGEGTWEAHFGA